MIPGSTYYNIPLINEQEFGITHDNGLIRIPTRIPNLCETYIKLVKYDKKETWSKIFDIISNDNEGAI